MDGIRRATADDGQALGFDVGIADVAFAIDGRDGRVVGVVTASAADPPSRTLVIDQLGVAGDQRGRGYGSALLGTVVAAARRAGFSDCTIEPPIRSAAVDRLVRAHGFHRSPAGAFQVVFGPAGLTLIDAATDEDLELVAACGRIVAGDPIYDPPTLQAARAASPHRLDTLAIVDGMPVGIARAGPRADIVGEQLGDVWVGVVPEWRGAGVGGVLARHALRHLQFLGLSGAQATILEPEIAGLSFATRRGMVEVERHGQGELLLPVNLEPARLPSGLRIVQRIHRPDLEPGMYGVALEAVPDIPGVERQVVGSFDDFAASELRDVRRRPELCLIAFVRGRSGDEVVGYASLFDVDGFTAGLGLTGVRRAWRGRGIAGALKTAQIQLAQEHGFQRLVTSNELRNDVIRRINSRLGFRPLPGTVVVRGPLEYPIGLLGGDVG